MKTKRERTTLAGAPERAGGPAARRFVAVDDIRPDPDQPRKVFDKAKLEELARSIKEQGIIQDLIVEFRPAVRATEPDLVTKTWRAVEEGTGRVLLTGEERMVRDYVHGKTEAWYQLVDGERRWKAAIMAGLKEVPVAVRVIEEKHRLALQVVANQQHEALNALEEAAAYRKEIDEGRHTAESLYKTLGISRGTLFARLALNRLHPPVRAALEQGKISVSVAGLVTMVPGLEHQKVLVNRLTDEENWQYPWSFRDVQQHIEKEFCRQLKGAPFDPKKTYAGEFKEGKDEGAAGELGGTVMLASRGPCTECCYRSGNLGVEGIGNPNVCTRVKCFEAKTAAAWKEQSAKAAAAGQKTLSAAEFAKVKGQYVTPEQGEYIGSEWTNWTKAMGRHGKAVERILVQTPEGGSVEVVARAKAKEAAVKNGIKFPKPNGGGPNWGEREKLRKERAAITERAVAKAKPLVEAKLKELTSVEALRLIAVRLGEELRHCGKSQFKPEQIAKWNQAKLEEELLRLSYLQDDGIDYEGKLDDRFVRICQVCNIAVETMLKEEQAAAKLATTHSPPATRQGGGANQKQSVKEDDEENQ